MRHGSKLTILCLMLYTGTALAAQESTPESKSEPTQPQSTVQQPRVVVLQAQVRVSRDVSQVLVVKRVQPEYPQEAREKRIQGDVVLHIVVSREGVAGKADLVSGHPLLAAAAIDAVKQWKYQPYSMNGHPVGMDTEAVVSFSLEAGEGHPGDAVHPDTTPPVATGVVGDAPGGIPPAQTSGVVGGIISSRPGASAVATPLRVRVSQGVAQGLLVKRVSPEYPLQARLGRIQGAVFLHVIISKTGDVATVGLISGHPSLAPAAIDAVKQWKYKPYLLDGKPVEVDAQVQVNFALAGT